MYSVALNCKYSPLSLSRLRSSRINAYLEVKIWSLFLTTGNKILWKRVGAISTLFNKIFNISLTSGVRLHIHLWNVVVLHLCFPQFCKSDTSRYGYYEVFFREFLGLRDNESGMYWTNVFNSAIIDFFKSQQIYLPSLLLEISYCNSPFSFFFFVFLFLCFLFCFVLCNCSFEKFQLVIGLNFCLYFLFLYFICF